MTAAAIVVDAFVFDAYGTLFDVHSVAAAADRLFPGRGEALSRLWRAKQLEYTWLTSLMAGAGDAAAATRPDFATVTAQALDYALAAQGLVLGADGRATLQAAYLALSVFPDVPAALSALAPRPRWILSNGTQAMLAPLVRHAGLEHHLAGVLSVDTVDVYKPSPRVYRLALDRLGIPAARIGFVSSNCWDAIGAKAFGFRVFWINRTGAPVDRHGPPPDHVIGTLADLPPLLRE